MRELAAQLGVTESRISQMRAEALKLLRDGMNSQLAPELVDVPANAGGAVARRKASYYAQVAARSSYRDRLTGARHLLAESTLFGEKVTA